MLVLPNLTIEPSNVRKKKRITKCNKSTVTYDVSTAQFKDDTINCEKKIQVQLNMEKVRSNVMLVLLLRLILTSPVREEAQQHVQTKVSKQEKAIKSKWQE